MRAINSPDCTLKTFTASAASSATYRCFRCTTIPRTEWRGMPCLSSTTLRPEGRGHIERRAVTVLGKAPLAGRDERAGEKLPVGIALEKVRGHWCGFAGL